MGNSFFKRCLLSILRIKVYRIKITSHPGKLNNIIIRYRFSKRIRIPYLNIFVHEFSFNKFYFHLSASPSIIKSDITIHTAAFFEQKCGSKSNNAFTLITITDSFMACLYKGDQVNKINLKGDRTKY